MLRRLTGLACDTFLAGAGVPSTIPLGEIESQNAIALKACLLPADLAAHVVPRRRDGRGCRSMRGRGKLCGASRVPDNAASQEPRMSLAHVPMVARFGIDVGHYGGNVNFSRDMEYVSEEVLAQKGDGAMPVIVMRRAEFLYH
ncbi:hypothetical protein FMM79_02300 [Novosphingobium sp. BW1]|nr:hypothetical protein FMM79_02300 [Novosphingobium sp. BW1]